MRPRRPRLDLPSMRATTSSGSSTYSSGAPEDELAGVDDERLLVADLHELGEVLRRVGQVDRRDAVVVEDAERAAQAQVDAGRLDHGLVPRLDAHAALGHQAADRPVGEDRGRGHRGRSLPAGGVRAPYAWSARLARTTTERVRGGAGSAGSPCGPRRGRRGNGWRGWRGCLVPPSPPLGSCSGSGSALDGPPDDPQQPHDRDLEGEHEPEEAPRHVGHCTPAARRVHARVSAWMATRDGGAREGGAMARTVRRARRAAQPARAAALGAHLRAPAPAAEHPAQRAGDVQAPRGHRQRGRSRRAQQRGAHPRPAEVGPRAGQQDRRAGHLRRGHRRARAQLVAAAARGGEDLLAGRGEVDAGAPEAGRRRQGAALVGRGDRDEVGRVEGGGVGRDHVVVGVRVAGGRDDEDVGGGGRVDGRGQVGAGARAREREVDHARAVGDRVAHARGHVAMSPDASAPRTLTAMMRARQARPATPTPLLPRARDDARDVRAVAVVVGGVAVAVDEVGAVDVVDEAVAVVVDAVARHLARVGPQVGREVAMGEVDAGVDHGDGDVAARDLASTRWRRPWARRPAAPTGWRAEGRVEPRRGPRSRRGPRRQRQAPRRGEGSEASVL